MKAFYRTKPRLQGVCLDIRQIFCFVFLKAKEGPNTPFLNHENVSERGNVGACRKKLVHKRVKGLTG